MLRDTEGISDEVVFVPGALAAVVARFDGRRTLAEIAADSSAALGRTVSRGVVSRLAEELEAALMLDSSRFRAARAEAQQAFAAAPVRAAVHAGRAYHGDAPRLRRYIDESCLARAPQPTDPPGEMLALCAPHMDLWRAAEGYGHAYRALGDALSDGCANVDTFVVLGTSHARMRKPFAVCDKPFDTPLGPMHVDTDAVGELCAASGFDAREDAYNHKNEHSIEFQVVFLRHLLGRRSATIVPVLCGLGEAQCGGVDPAHDPRADSFLHALEAMVRRRRGKVMVIAGADLAHVGPRFGDRGALDALGRRALEARDRESIQHARDVDARSFFSHVVADLDTRRVCGVGPIYAMLRAMPSAVRGDLLHYAQCVDQKEGSVVSHASIGYYGPRRA
jgi:AmmeMemoRadiSam system protein B